MGNEFTILDERKKTYIVMDMDIDDELYAKMVDLGRELIKNDHNALAEYAIVECLKKATSESIMKELQEKDKKESEKDL
jgi:hypothetical protein